MTLRFRYHLHRTRDAVWPLGSRWVRPRPILVVSLTGPARTIVREGLLDTGSDDTVFSEKLAARLGIDLAAAPSGEATGVAGAPISVRYAEVKLRITDGREFREWPAWVAFTAAPLRQPLLGFAGFLQFFGAHFLGDREEVELTVNSLYPGT